VPEKSGFYETVTEVNSDLRLLLLGKALFFVFTAKHVVLHRVSTRTLFELFWLRGLKARPGPSGAQNLNLAKQTVLCLSITGVLVGVRGPNEYKATRPSYSAKLIIRRYDGLQAQSACFSRSRRSKHDGPVQYRDPFKSY
jgi:hypothetical protein